MPTTPTPSRPASPPANKADPRWAWHHHALLRLRARLTGEHHGRLHAATAPTGGEAVGFADRVSDQNERDLNIAELRAEENLLDEVDAALLRLHAGTYGVCEDTGRPVSAARLRAVPWTRWSHEAAQRRERAGEANA